MLVIIMIGPGKIEMRRGRARSRKGADDRISQLSPAKKNIDFLYDLSPIKWVIQKRVHI